jgi:hypothetical protein
LKKKIFACPKSQATWKNLSKVPEIIGQIGKKYIQVALKKSSMSPPIPGALSSQESTMQH